MNNYIHEYYQKIKDGSIVVGRWITLVYEYIEKGLQEKSFFYDSKKAEKAIKFIENFCHHSKGRNDLISLELWQKAAISTMFGIVDDKGTRQFREVIWILGRKNGKSLIASAVIACMVYIDGEYGADAFCVAPKLDQADIVYHAFWEMVKSEPELMALTKSRKSDFFIESTNSSIKKIAFSAKKSDGFNPHLTVCDEIAAWVGDAGKKQYEVMKSALGARKQPMLLSVSTAGYVNGGIYDELMMRATRFLMGDSKEKRLLPLLYMIDDVEKWNDINELQKSNPNLGVSVSVDYLLEEIAVAEGSLSKKAEFLTKYCNVKQNSSQAWLPTSAIKKCECDELTLEQFRNSYCVAGLDLSQTTDLTSACIIVERDGLLNVISHFWLPEEKLEDAIARDGLPYRDYIAKGWMSTSGQNFVDYADVFAWFRMLIEEYEIYPLKVGYDRYSSQYLIKDMEAYGFHCDDVYQGFNLTSPIQETEGQLKDGRMRLGNNDLLKIHLLDTALCQDAESRRVKIVKISVNAHIDGCAALLDAMCVRQKWYDTIGEQLKNGG